MMDNWPISLAAGVVKDHAPAKMVDAAAAAGFDGVGLWFEPGEWSAATTREVAARCRDAALPVVDIEVFRIKPGPLDADILRGADVALELGAQNFVMISYDPDPAATSAKLRAVCEHVGGQMNVALEFILFTEVKSLGAAVSILREVDHPSASVLLDPLHLERTGGAPAGIAHVDPSLVRYAQLCDIGPLTYELSDLSAVLEEAKEERLLCGEGTIDLPRFIAELPRPMPLSIELMSRDLRTRFPDAVTRARYLADQTRAYLASLRPGSGAA